MHRHALILACLVMGMVVPAIVARPDATEDEKLVGTWVLTSYEKDGKTMTPGADDPLSVVLSKGGKAVITVMGKAGKPCTWKTGVAGKIKQFDLIGPKEEGKPQDQIKVIYEVNGDTVKVAINPDPLKGDRPTSFDPKTAVIWTLKRQKP